MWNDISIIDQSVSVRVVTGKPVDEGLISDSWLAKSVSEINSSEKKFQFSGA